MANIEQELLAFKNAKKGEDVRDSMISAIRKINTVNEEGVEEIEEKTEQMVEVADSMIQIDEEPTSYTKLKFETTGTDIEVLTADELDDVLPETETVSDLKNAIQSYDEGKIAIGGSWLVGTLVRATGNYYLGNYTYRICTPDFVEFEENTTFAIASGYALQVFKFLSDGTKDGNPIDYTGTYTAPANTKLKFVIMTNPEDTSVVANVSTFRSKVTTTSNTQKQINALNTIVSGMSDGYEKYLKSTDAELSFSSHAINSTYQVEWFNCDIPVGETVNIEIVCPANDANTSYLNLNDADNARLNPSALYTGTATRTVTFTNNYAKAVAKIGLTLVKVNVQNTYSVSVYKPTYLPTRVETLEADVADILNTNDVPTYFQSQLNTAISTAQTNMLSAGINGETFVFISDIHWEDNQKHSPVLIGEVTKNLNIENVVFGGDAINGGTQAEAIADMNEIRQMFEKASKRFLSIFGNHDSNAQDGGVTFTNREFYTLLQKQNDYNVTYIYPYFYYMDNPATKTRMIFLDTGMTNPSNPTAEMSWLQSAVNGASNGWHILVFAHVIYTPSGGDYGDPSTYQMTSFMTDACTYLDSINSAGQKYVDAIFGGHCHLDYDSTSAGGIPIIMIDTDSSQTNSADGYTVGTITEQCFDIVTVNYSSKTINCTRVGRGSNRVFTY